MIRLPPGPRAPAIVQTLEWVRRPTRYLERARARYGPVFTSRVVAFPPLVHFCDPEAVREIFAGDPDLFRAGEANRILEPVLGPSSLFVLDGARHARQRRLLLGLFQGPRFQSHEDGIRQIAQESVARWPRGRAFPVHPRTRGITLDVILMTVFGTRDPDLRRELGQLLDGMTHPIFLLPRAQKDLGPLTPWGRFARLMKSINGRIDAMIRERRARPGGGDDVLSLLLEACVAEGELMAEREIKDELMTLLVAGHDTVATGLAWALHYLSLSPALPSDDEWLDAAIKESLRLMPVLPIVSRCLHADTTVAGVPLPRGSRATPNVYLAHREAAHWPDPLRFEPSRFLGNKPAPWAYFPFGGGVRRCIGMAFALFEMRVILATVLRALRIAPGGRVTPVRRGITLAPSDGMPLVVHDRG